MAELSDRWSHGLVRYPDPAIAVIDKRFEKYKLSNGAVERIWSGGRWSEGPVWFGDGRHLLFSDIPNNRMLRWVEETGQVTVFRSPANFSNGNTRDKQGRLITCEHGSRCVTRTEYDGTITVLMDNFGGKRLNAPNDVVVHPDGHIWFTDPGYGILKDYEGGKADFELPTCIYRLDPTSGEATVATDEQERPNGLCFSPDYTKLYVVDSGSARNIVVYDVVDQARLTNRRLFVEMKPGSSDGIRCDVDGNLWAAATWGGDGFDGVHIFAPGGDLIGKIHLPEACSNLCFGGVKRNRLFITASQSVYAVYVETQGAQLP